MWLLSSETVGVTGPNPLKGVMGGAGAGVMESGEEVAEISSTADAHVPTTRSVRKSAETVAGSTINFAGAINR